MTLLLAWPSSSAVASYIDYYYYYAFSSIYPFLSFFFVIFVFAKRAFLLLSLLALYTQPAFKSSIMPISTSPTKTVDVCRDGIFPFKISPLSQIQCYDVASTTILHFSMSTLPLTQLLLARR